MRSLTAKLTDLARHNTYAFSALLVSALVIATLIQDNGNFGLSDQLAIAAPMTIAALASAPAIIGGGFDLSISPLVVFTNCVYVVWLAPHGLGGAVAVPIVLGVGLVTGLFTGLMITILRVQPVVVTLAMYFALQGVDLLLAPNPVSLGEQHRWIYDLAGKVGPIPGALFTIGAPLLIWFLLKYVPFRRLLFAVGSNDATAFSAGVNVTAVRIASYGLGGLFAGCGGLALTALVQSANAASSTQYALPAIAAVVLGGTSLAGGRGGLIGVVFGGILDLPAAEPAGELPGQPGVAADRLRRHPDRRSRDPGRACSRVGNRRAPARAHAALASHPAPRRAASRCWTRPSPTAHRSPAPRPARSGRRRRASLLAPGRRGRWLARLQQRFPLIQLLALAAVFAYGVITLPGLGSWISIRSILVLASLVGLASCGQTLLILMGGFDLGVAGFIVAGGFAVTALKVKYGLDFGTALALSLIVAAALGGFAGYICHRFRINPLVVTLAMGSIVVGLVKVQMGVQTNGYPPQWLIDLAEPVTKTFGVGIPPSVAIWVVVVVLFAIFLHRTRMGRNLFATGSNPRAADRALINTRRIWIAAFAFSAVTSALVGVLIGGFGGIIADNGGDAYLFQSVVAVIVGGTVFGGPGDYTRTSIGALFLTVLVTVLIGHGASPAQQQIVYGAIILAAVAIYGRERRLRDRV